MQEANRLPPRRIRHILCLKKLWLYSWSKDIKLNIEKHALKFLKRLYIISFIVFQSYCVISILFVEVFSLDFSATNEKQNVIDKLDSSSLTVHQLLEAMPGNKSKHIIKETNKKVISKQQIIRQLPKLDVKVCNYTITKKACNRSFWSITLQGRVVSGFNNSDSNSQTWKLTNIKGHSRL